MNDNKALVVVLSRNYSTGLGIVRSLGTAGYTIDLIASSHNAGDAQIISCSKYVRNSVEVVTRHIKNGKEDVRLLDELLKYEGKYEQKPVLFPTDDYTASVMDMHRDLLEDIFIMPTIVGGGNGCMTDRMAKSFQAQLARDAGLLTPQEWSVSLRDDIQIPEDMVYPCFVKPQESVTGFKTEMARCNTQKGLKKHLKKMKRRYAERSVLVQEFLVIDHEIDFSGVCLDQQIVIPGIIKKWNVAKFEKGVTMCGSVHPVGELGELYDKIVEMLKKFHYVGMFDMELNVVGDKIYFNEVNLRCGGPNFSYFMSGANLPAMYVRAALGEKDNKEERITEFGKTFIYEKVAWEDHIHGYMSRQELEDRIAQADITLLNHADDPAPGKYFKRVVRHAAVKARRKQRSARFMKICGRIRRNLRRDFQPMLNQLAVIKGRLLNFPQYKKENRRDPFAETPRVLIAGRNFCSNLTMARSLGQAGYEAEVLRIFQKRPSRLTPNRYLKPDAYSKYVKAYHVCVSHRLNKRIVRALRRAADPYRKMLLIPADDLVANIADKYMKQLSRYYLMPNVANTPGEIGRLMSKEVQKKLAKDAGLPVVNSCVIHAKRGAFIIPEAVTYPCFIKPNISKNSSKSHMRKCETREDLVRTLEEFSRKKEIEMLVEDYLEIEKEYALLGLSTRDGVVAPGYFVTEEGGHDAHRGVAMIGRILATEEAQQLIDDIKKFVASLQFEGLFDVDLIETADGKLYFTELNLRFGASGYAVTQSGVNLPAMFADYMIKGKPIDLDCKITEPGKRFISEKIMLDEYINGYLTKADMRQRMKSVDIHFIQNEEDRAAFRHFKRYYPLATNLRRIVRKKKARKAMKQAQRMAKAAAEQAQIQSQPETP